jgi:hypothetical protein
MILSGPYADRFGFEEGGLYHRLWFEKVSILTAKEGEVSGNRVVLPILCCVYL